MKFPLLPSVIILATAPASGALAWGFEGHAIVAAIARDALTPKARAAVDSLLADDKDTLTAPDLLARASWADAWRGAGHKETAEWHYVDIEIDAPDIRSACNGFPAISGLASVGPAHDCIIDKIDAFRSELADPAVPEAEKIIALKYVLHFVGDLHQPLHASDHEDKGGNCVMVALGGSRTLNLHSYWDTAVLAPLGPDPEAAAKALEKEITPSDRKAWLQGGPQQWALESFAVARTSVYSFNPPPGCASDRAPIALTDAYQAEALRIARLQLMKAGVRLAYVLNAAMGR